MSLPHPLGNTLARASLVFGLLGFLVPPFVAPLIAIVAGHVARTQIQRRGSLMHNDTIAAAGPTPGWIGLIVLLIATAVMVLWVIPALKEVGGVLLDAMLLRSH